MIKKLDDVTNQFIQDFQSNIEDIISLPVEEQRAWERREALKKLDGYKPVGSIKDHVIDGKHGQIQLRIYSPLGNQKDKLPVIVYFHGGGWVYKGITELEGVCRNLCRSLNSIVVSVEYRLAPENKFPIPLDDCYDAVVWISKNCEKFHGHADLVGVAGDSAGGNLAAAVCLKAKELEFPNIKFQILIYPVIDPNLKEEPYRQCADQQFMTKNMMQFFWDSYLESSDDSQNPYAAPLKALSFAQLPQAYMITAEHDPLRMEAEAYAKAIDSAGGDVTIEQYPNVIHGFLEFPIHPKEVDQAYMNLNKWFCKKVLPPL